MYIHAGFPRKYRYDDDAGARGDHIFTSTSPLSTLTSYMTSGSFCVDRGFPVVTSNFEPCSGQVMMASSMVPFESRTPHVRALVLERVIPASDIYDGNVGAYGRNVDGLHLPRRNVVFPDKLRELSHA